MTAPHPRRPDCLRAAGALLFLLATACEPAERPRPNVLLVSIDTLRADHLSCYGYERQTSPRLDRLAKEGVLFERAVSTTSWTLPAHLSMLTGLPISAHGACDDRLWDRRDADGELIPPPLRGTFFAESLQAAGYSTAGYFTWKYLDDQFGFGPGFDVWERVGWDLFSHPELGPRFLELKRNNDIEGMKALAAEHPDLIDAKRRTSPETIDRAIRWIDERGIDERGSVDAPQPFFLFVHLFDVHDPYLPPPEHDRFGDPAYAGPIDGMRITAPDSPVRGDMSAADMERLVSLYDGGISFVDSEVGRLLDHLEERGLARDTLVIVTSDHGEEFYEHGHKTHRRQLYVESVQVPLILHWPRGLPSGARLKGTVGLVDLAPTILATCGVTPPLPLPGVNLVPIALGEQANDPRSYDSLLFVFEGGRVLERQIGIFRGDEHALLVHRPGSPWSGERYDLARDPHERSGAQPFGPDDAASAEIVERVERMREAYGALRARLPERGAWLPALDEFDKSQLAALGYTGVSEETQSSDEQERSCMDGCVWME